jgi:hypothetical protein
VTEAESEDNVDPAEEMDGAPKTNRTSDLPLRRGLLYPLSYRGEPGGRAECDCDGNAPPLDAGRFYRNLLRPYTAVMRVRFAVDVCPARLPVLAPFRGATRFVPAP